MSLRVRDDERSGQPIVVLEDDAGNGLEIWPGEGFSAYRWYVEHGGRQELLWFSPSLFTDKKPTRSGNPILFPFPNRIRNARYTWEGKEYELPVTDSNGKNSIHGFVCRLPWRLTQRGADASHAWVSAEFQLSKDAPQFLPCWPADFILRLTYQFFGYRVRQEVEVINPDSKSLPFGLGFHPYFSLSAFGKEESVLSVPARQFWPLEECLPAGKPQPVAGMRDIQVGKESGQLKLDDVLTDLDISTRNAEGLGRIGMIADWQKRRRLEVFAAPAFREVVVFNPVHREAFCIEPYTCVTDAVNLAAQGWDAGWTSLAPGKRWSTVVEWAFAGDG